MYVLGPLVVAVALGVLILIARWAVGQDGPPLGGDPQYGLLEPVADGISADDLNAIQAALLDAGVRNTVAESPGGYRLLVWPADLARARRLVRQVRGLS